MQNWKEKRRKGKLTLVRPLSYVVIDIETTGLDVARSAIIEIGAIHVRNGAVSGRFQTFLTPEPYQSLSPFITNLTSITDSDLVGAPTFRETPAAAAGFFRWLYLGRAQCQF